MSIDIYREIIDYLCEEYPDDCSCLKKCETLDEFSIEDCLVIECGVEEKELNELINEVVSDDSEE